MKIFIGPQLTSRINSTWKFSSVQGWGIPDELSILVYKDVLYISQKQLPRKMKMRLVITVCAGFIFRQLFFFDEYSFLYSCIFCVDTHIYFSQKQLPENIARALCNN